MDMEDPVKSITTWQAARDQLRIWREENERKSDEIVELWLKPLGVNAHKLGDEKWMVLEQVVIAALDLHNYDVADHAVMELKNRFPNSDRVKLLQVMRLQALERYDEAMKGVDAMIARDPTNSAAYKRRIAILKSEGKSSEAIKALTEYLNKFMSDQEAWSELCDLHLAEADYNRAAFCAEELILHTPHNYFVHQRCAEIRYTMGGIDNMKLAVSYYSQALKLNADSMRSLFGLYLSASNLVANPRVASAEKKENSKVAAWASEEITKRYAKTSTKSKEDVVDDEDESENNLKMIQGVFGALQIQ